MYYGLGEYNQAKELHEKALMIRKKIFDEHHADVASSYHKLAVVYHSLREYNQAIELQVKALIMSKKIFGENHVIVARCYNNLASVYSNLQEYNQAKQLHEKALMIRKKDFLWRSCWCSIKLSQIGSSVPTTAWKNSYNNLAIV